MKNLRSLVSDLHLKMDRIQYIPCFNAAREFNSHLDHVFSSCEIPTREGSHFFDALYLELQCGYVSPPVQLHTTQYSAYFNFTALSCILDLKRLVLKSLQLKKEKKR